MHGLQCTAKVLLLAEDNVVDPDSYIMYYSINCRTDGACHPYECYYISDRCFVGKFKLILLKPYYAAISYFMSFAIIFLMFLILYIVCIGTSSKLTMRPAACVHLFHGRILESDIVHERLEKCHIYFMAYKLV